MVLNGNLRLFHLTTTSCNLNKHCRSWSDAAFCGVWSGSVLFANVPFQVLHWTDVTENNTAAINNRYLEFVQSRGRISLVNDNQLDNYVKDILAFTYYGVKNRPKITELDCRENTIAYFLGSFCFNLFIPGFPQWALPCLKFGHVHFVNMYISSNLELNGKQCRSWWEGSSRAVSPGSTLFA